MLSDDAMHERMRKGWRGGLGDGTVCGRGSTMRCSQNAIEWLPEVCEDYKIRTVNDAGAGDLHWIKRVQWNVQYRAFDLIPRHPSVRELDITTEDMPPADAILCRFVLNHLIDDDDYERITMALRRFANAATYLIATNFDSGPKTRTFHRLNLNDWLGKPLEKIQDGHEQGCSLALWTM